MPSAAGRARRTIDIDEATVAASREWGVTQLEERFAWGDAYHDSGRIFTRENGLPLDPDGTSSRWNRLVRASGLPRIRFHDARHTHATLLLKAGVPPHVVSQRLGHASVAFILQQYAHLLPQQQREAVSRLSALIDVQPDMSGDVRLSSDEETPRPSDLEIGP